MEDASQLLSATATTVSPTSGPTLSTAVNIVAGTALVAAVSVSAPGRGGIGSNSAVQDMITAAVSATLSTVAETATAAAAGSSLVETVQSTVVAETRHLISIQLPAFVQQLWTWQPTFMQGFILGQFSMLVLLIMAIKYILFEEPLGKKPLDEDEAPMAFSPTASAAAGDAEAKGRTIIQEGGFGLSKFMIFSRKPKDPPPDDLAEELTKMHKEILSRTGYDLLARRSESCDWLTVFLAQIISKFRADAERHDRLVRVISEALNGELRPSVIDNLRITQFSLGSDFLRVTSARMVPSAGSLGMRAELDLALHDEITLGFNTRVLVNWPRPSVAALPVSMVVSLVKFVGTVAIEFDCASPEPSVSVTILPDYVLEFDVQTLIGSKAKVQNLPMLTSVISRKLQAAFAKELVMPNEKRIKIKHPFTPKAPGTTTTAQTSAAASASVPGAPTATNASATAASNIPQSPTVDPNSPVSQIGPMVAELPPNYNTQLPPPHPMLRSNLQSRATANSNTSPTMGIPPRMYTPEEPTLMGNPILRPSVGAQMPLTQPQQPGFQRAWSPSLSSGYGGLSPQMRPIVGISSSALLGPSMMTNSRIISARPRLGGNNGPFLHTPGLASALASGGSGAGSTVGSHIMHPSSSSRQTDADTDDMQVKDSVRQRVNRVIRTVNES